MKRLAPTEYFFSVCPEAQMDMILFYGAWVRIKNGQFCWNVCRFSARAYLEDHFIFIMWTQKVTQKSRMPLSSFGAPTYKEVRGCFFC